MPTILLFHVGYNKEIVFYKFILFILFIFVILKYSLYICIDFYHNKKTNSNNIKLMVLLKFFNF